MTDFISLEDAFKQIAEDAGLNSDDLIAYAAEDTIGGRDTGAWSGMGVFSVEGKFLYALARALKPEGILEVGVHEGGTTRHLLTALQANGDGNLVSVDIEPVQPLPVNPELLTRWQFIQADALGITSIMCAGLIVEDGAHTFDFTCAILERLKTLNPRIILSHDYYSHEVYEGQFFVKAAWDKVLPDGKGLKLEGAFTGLGYWVNPAYQTEPIEPTSSPTPPTPQSPAPKAPAKKKPGRKPKAAK